MTNRHAPVNDALASVPPVLRHSEDVESFERAENLLQSRLAKTRREIRRVDLFTACFSCATLALAVLFLGVLCDGWIFSEGLSVRGRVFFVLLLLVVSATSFLWKVAPILRRRVNALYAAKILEETQQDKHNLTINWLQLCHGTDQESHAKGDYDSPFDQSATDSQRETLKIVALQAASISKQTPDETAADCSSLVRWGIALAVLASICAIYAILSPKNPFVSAKRIVAPTASVERPQALRFDSVEPGDVAVFQGDFLEIEATISGAKTSEKVEVLWDTEDGRVSDVAIPMESTGPSRFKATLPDAPEGFSENLNYRVVAGRGSRFESSSGVFHATVRPQPSFRVENTTLKFPAYTGLPPQTFENQGDVRAVENTTVEIVARATEKLNRAYLLPDGDQTRAIKMAIRPDEPEVATASFTLQWSDEERRLPLFSSYTLLSEDVGGEKNRDAQVYDVSILADLPPAIRWESGNSEVAQVPLNDVLRVAFVAEDPDYSIRRAELHVAHNVQQGDQADQKNNPKPIELPLSAPSSEIAPQGATPFVGPQTLRYALIPEKLGLNVGDELEYWGVVFDSKTPEANVGVSEKRVFVVVDPVDSPSDPDENAEEPPQNEDSGKAPGSESSANQNEGSEDSDSSSTNDGQNEDGDEKEPNANQQNNAGQEGETTGSDAASEQQSENGEETGEKASQRNDAQNQNGMKTNSGAASESTQGDEQGGEGNQDANSEGDNAADADSSEQSAGDSPDGDSSTSPQNGDPANSGGKGTSDPSDDNLTNDNPSSTDAFQKILDYMNANALNENGDEPNSDGNNASEGAKASDQLNKSNDASDDVSNTQDEVAPNFEPSNDPSPTQEKRTLPTRTSPDKPSDDAPAYQAENPEKIDPNARRRQGDVDPNVNDFLAQNASPDQQEATSSPQKNRNSNITLDPLDQNPSTAADAVDPNASEAKGAPGNVPEGGATEIDSEGKDASGQSSSSNSDNSLSPNAASSSPDAEGQNNGDNSFGFPNSQDGGPESSGKRDPSKKKGETPSRGGSDDLGVAHGGGGAGSGLGEIEQGEERLAPADAPRLQYAEKATSLVLEYLEDSLKGKVDKKLLDELDWTEEEARAFLDRWKKMRDAAFQDDDARDRYLEALKNVGLDERASLDDSTPVDSTWNRDPDDARTRSGTREASRFKTPDRLSERVRAFTRGVSSSSGVSQ